MKKIFSFSTMNAGYKPADYSRHELASTQSKATNSRQWKNTENRYY
ncbi:MAG: hypothetical protein WCG87_11000 [Bacteroidota bacterium]